LWVVHRYFDEISQDTGKYCFGVDDTLQCLDMGAVETLIVWENLEVVASRALFSFRS
jgi:peptide chain release factor subunit 1